MKLLNVQIYPVSCYFLFGLGFFALYIEMKGFLRTIQVSFLLTLIHIPVNTPFRCYHPHTSTVQRHCAVPSLTHHHCTVPPLTNQHCAVPPLTHQHSAVPPLTPPMCSATTHTPPLTHHSSHTTTHTQPLYSATPPPDLTQPQSHSICRLPTAKYFSFIVCQI